MENEMVRMWSAITRMAMSLLRIGSILDSCHLGYFFNNGLENIGIIVWCFLAVRFKDVPEAHIPVSITLAGSAPDYRRLGGCIAWKKVRFPTLMALVNKVSVRFNGLTLGITTQVDESRTGTAGDHHLQKFIVLVSVDNSVSRQKLSPVLASLSRSRFSWIAFEYGCAYKRLGSLQRLQPSIPRPALASFLK